MWENDPFFKAICTFNGMVLLDGPEKTLSAMISEMDMNVDADYRCRCKTLMHVDIPHWFLYRKKVPVYKRMLPCPTLLDAHGSSARCTSRFWWCDPQLWPRWTSSSWTTSTATRSTWRPACALAVCNRLCLLHVTKKGTDLSGKQKCTKFFCNFMLATKNTDDRRRFPIKDFSGRPLLDLTVVDFMPFLLANSCWCVVLFARVFQKRSFLLLRPWNLSNWFMSSLPSCQLDFCNLPRFPANWMSYQVP